MNAAYEVDLNRFESTVRLSHPSSAPAELARIVDEELRRAGLNPAAIRQAAARKEEREKEATRQRIRSAASQFLQSHPEFVQCEANEQLMFEWIVKNDMKLDDPLAYGEAYANIQETLIQPTKRVRTAPRVQVIDGVEISHAALDRLTAKELERLCMNPRAVAAINALR